MHDEREHGSITVKYTVSEHGARLIAVGCVAVWLLSFGAGYWLGVQRSYAKPLLESHNQRLEDALSARLLSLYDDRTVLSSTEVSGGPDSSSAEEAASLAESASDTDAGEKSAASEHDQPLYYATLAGYGTARAAQAYVDQLARRGVVAIVRERHSVNKRGKRIRWYQVITAPASRDSTTQLVQELERKDGLRDVAIVPVTPEPQRVNTEGGA